MINENVNDDFKVGDVNDLNKAVLGDRAADLEVKSPLVDPPTDPPVDPPIDPPVIDPKIDPPVDPPIDPPPADDIKEKVFEIFNKQFGTDFEDDDTLKTLLDNPQRIEELEGKIKEIDSLKEQNLLLRENLDPMKYFASEDDYKIAQFKKQFPDKNPSVAYSLLASNLDDMSSKDLIVYGEMLDNPGIKENVVRQIIDERYEIEEGEGISETTEAKMTMAANSVKRNVNTLKGQITLPDKIDVDSLSKQQADLLAEKKTRLTEGWSNITDGISKTLDDIVITDTVDGDEVELFRYSIDKDFPQEDVKAVAEYMSNSGVEVSKEAAQSAAQVMKQRYVTDNLNKIIKSAIDNERAKAEEARLNKQHNPGSDKPDGNVEPKKDDHNAKMMNDLKATGWHRPQI